MGNMASTRATVLIAAGGTGGHVFPALAVAQGLRQQDVEVVWLGTRKGIESRVVPANDFVIHFINVAGVRGKNLLSWIAAPLLLALAVISVIRLIVKIKPVCVLGMGGFASAAAGFAAFITRTPLLLQEQNSIAGTTNKLLAPMASKIFTGFPGVFSQRKTTCFTGNPLRAELYVQLPPAQRIDVASQSLQLLVLGGSLGAHALNQVLPRALAQLKQSHSNIDIFNVVHQTGINDVEMVNAAYSQVGVEAKVSAFIEDMAVAYAAADLVIARAGALTVSEIAAVGVAALLVPYPHATDNHQSFNADWLVDAGAAVKVEQSEFTVETAVKLLQGLLADKQRLLERATHARALATPEATQYIVDSCREFAHG